MGNQVAFIGLGRMGAPIAANILKRGLPLTVWNRTASKMDPLAALGAKPAASAREAVAGADIVVTSLMDDKSILDALHGANGILAGMAPESAHLCITTISPGFADELTRTHARHGSSYISGPVVGRPSAAEAGELTTYLAGNTAAMPRAQEVARTYCKTVHVVGDNARMANAIKLCINYSVVSVIETIGEAYALAEKSGVDPAILNDWYQMAFAHPALKHYGDRILKRDFGSQGGFALSGGRKDVGLMLQAAREAGVALEIGNIVARKMDAALDKGLSEMDWSVLSEFSRLAGETDRR